MIDRLAHPEFLLLLLAIPLAVALWRRPRRRTWVRFPSLEIVRPIPPTLRQRIAWLPFALRLFALVLLAIAIARPQSVLGSTRVSTEGIAMQLVVDRSGSMAEPIPFGGEVISRLDAVKIVLREFVLGTEAAQIDAPAARRSRDSLPGRRDDMIGLISFARYADTVAPLVRDPEAIASLVETIGFARYRFEDGTAIGDGLALAAARLKAAEEELARRDALLAADASSDGDTPPPELRPEFTIRSKVIVLLTDGYANAGDLTPVQAAQLAAEWGIRVYTVGIGGEGRLLQTPAGTIRIPGGGPDTRTLRAVAEITGGRHFEASDTDSLREVYAAIDELEKTRIETAELTDHREEFWPLAAGAAILLALEALLSATFLRRTA